MNYKELKQPVIFFDGVCNLCTAAVQFIIRNDKKGTFLFASLQSQAGREVVEATEIKDITGHSGTIVLYYRKKYYIRSSAIIKVANLLGGVWTLLAALYIIPTPLRNLIYNWVAKNRYKWFGKRNECLLPAPENKSRFIE